MNKQITSKEQILRAGKEILLNEGAQAFSIRSVAAKCTISIGTIYNYFPSKAALLSAVVQSIWLDIFRPINAASFSSFTECVQSIFQAVYAAEQQHPGFTTLHKMHFAENEKSEGRASMRESHHIMQEILVRALQNDASIRPHAFDAPLTMEIFAEYIITLMTHLLMQHKPNCHALLTMIRQCIY